MIYVIKDDNKFYSQLYLDHALYNEQIQPKELEKNISKELMPPAQHPAKWWDCCMPEVGKKGVGLILSDKVEKQ